jgi:hypothetical protein
MLINSNARSEVLRGRRSRPCPAVSISLGDLAPDNEWFVEVRARRDEGGFVLLGSVQTTAPGRGARDRLVAIASCPGAVEWSVRCLPVALLDDGETLSAEVSLSVAPYAGFGPALVAVPPASTLVGATTVVTGTVTAATAGPLALSALITTTTTPTQLSASPTNYLHGTVFEASPFNSESVRVSGLTLEPGDKMALPLSDWSTVYVSSNTGGQNLQALGFA